MAAHLSLIGERAAPSLAALADGDVAANRSAARALAVRALAALDAQGLSDAAQRLGVTTLEGAVAFEWAQALAGGGYRAAEIAAVRERAHACPDAAWRIEAFALESFARGVDGDIETAVRLGRHAVRMARTEALWPMTMLAGWALSRARRLEGRPNVAKRIVQTLRRGAGPVWEPLLGWELALCGGVPERGPGRELRTAIESPVALDALAVSLGAAVSHRRELHQLWVCAMLDAPAEHAPLAAAWRRGEGDRVPAGLSQAMGGTSGEGTFGWIAVRKGSPVSRFLAPGPRADRGITFLAVDRPRVRRFLAGLAWSADSAIDESALFRRVYGFDYDAPTHGSLYRMLLHRARDAVAAVGSIERNAGGLCLSLQVPVAFADPRSEVSLEDRLLSLLAEEPGLGAGEIAAKVGAAKRTVQRTLRGLVEEKVVADHRQHRAVTYTVEDTTFAEPTDWGIALGS